MCSGARCCAAAARLRPPLRASLRHCRARITKARCYCAFSVAMRAVRGLRGWLGF